MVEVVSCDASPMVTTCQPAACSWLCAVEAAIVPPNPFRTVSGIFFHAGFACFAGTLPVPPGGGVPWDVAGFLCVGGVVIVAELPPEALCSTHPKMKSAAAR